MTPVVLIKIGLGSVQLALCKNVTGTPSLMQSCGLLLNCSNFHPTCRSVDQVSEPDFGISLARFLFLFLRQSDSQSFLNLSIAEKTRRLYLVPLANGDLEGTCITKTNIPSIGRTLRTKRWDPLTETCPSETCLGRVKVPSLDRSM